MIWKGDISAVEELMEALSGAFEWQFTSQGHDYWDGFYMSLDELLKEVKE